MKNLIFYLGVGALSTHELDAMTNHEWRVLPLVRQLPEPLAADLFVWVHIPLFAAIFALLASQDEKIRNITRYSISAFLVIHSFLHYFHETHPAYEFQTFLSSFLIYGGAMFGALFLALEFKAHRSNAT